jgi:hypothetical protein
MRLLQTLCFVAIICGFGFSQTISSTAEAGNTNIDELTKLRQTMADQQKSIAEQQKSIADQQGQIAAQQREIERLRQQLGAQPQDSSAQTPPQFVNATLNTSASSMPRSASDAPAQERPKESPLSFRIGGADFTPGGFVDFENIFRTTNTGNAATSSFGVIPFSNTVAGHLTEFRSTAQYSRVSLNVSDRIGKNNVVGYLETDFNGNDATTVFQATNPHTLRLRLYWLDIRRDKWAFLGGQSWSWLSPNRTGLSPVPSDLAITVNEDSNINVGRGCSMHRRPPGTSSLRCRPAAALPEMPAKAGQLPCAPDPCPPGEAGPPPECRE